MARGDVIVFEEARQNITIKDSVDLTNTATFVVRLIDSLPQAADTTPDSSDYTEVAGTGYAEIELTTSWTEVDGVVTFGCLDVPTWAKNAAGPEDIRAALIYTKDITVVEDALCFFDMTLDAGVTPVSLRTGEIALTFSAAGIFSLTQV